MLQGNLEKGQSQQEPKREPGPEGLRSLSEAYAAAFPWRVSCR